MIPTAPQTVNSKGGETNFFCPFRPSCRANFLFSVWNQQLESNLHDQNHYTVCNNGKQHSLAVPGSATSLTSWLAQSMVEQISRNSTHVSNELSWSRIIFTCVKIVSQRLWAQWEMINTTTDSETPRVSNHEPTQHCKYNVWTTISKRQLSNSGHLKMQPLFNIWWLPSPHIGSKFQKANLPKHRASAKRSWVPTIFIKYAQPFWVKVNQRYRLQLVRLRRGSKVLLIEGVESSALPGVSSLTFSCDRDQAQPLAHWQRCQYGSVSSKMKLSHLLTTCHCYFVCAFLTAFFVEWLNMHTRK